MADPNVLAVMAFAERTKIRRFIEEHGTDERRARLENHYPLEPARPGEPQTEAYNIELMVGLMEIVEGIRQEYPKKRPPGRPRKESKDA